MTTGNVDGVESGGSKPCDECSDLLHTVAHLRGLYATALLQPDIEQSNCCFPRRASWPGNNFESNCQFTARCNQCEAVSYALNLAVCVWRHDRGAEPCQRFTQVRSDGLEAFRVRPESS